MSTTLDPILRPRSIAVIGASRNTESIGYGIVDNLLKHGFTGPVYPVNPSASTVHSIRAFASIGDVPDDVDLAVVVVPADIVIPVVRECVHAGVKGLVVISAGFKEVGGRGIERERELMAVLERSGVRMVGPNCMGVINTEPAVRMNATFAPAMPPAGSVAFISQSGAMGVSILDYAESLDIGMSMFVSSGNKADVSGNDLLEYWEHDPDTKLVLMYIENFGNPARFIELGRTVTRKKPIFIVKSGRTGAGQRAAESHTGALAQTELATDAIIAQAGAMRAQSVNELFDFAMAFSNQPLPKGNRVAIVTNAGGPGIIIADACETNDLVVATLSHETEEKLRARLPAEASVTNPVDLIASATPPAYQFALQCVLDDDGVDAAIAAFVPPLGIHTQDVAEAIVHVADACEDKPILAVLMGREGLPAGLAELHEANVPTYLFPEPAARALGAMWRYAQTKERPVGRAISYDVDDAAVVSIVDNALKRGHAKLSEADALRVLEAYGVPVVPWRFVAREDTERFPQAVATAAADVGFPVAVKVVTPAITHKTDIGGVLLNIESGDAVVRAVDEVLQHLAQAGHTDIEGVVVQQMAAPGRETIVGITLIPTVGPVVMFGLGGVYVEVVRDVVLRLCPLLDSDAAEMIGEVKMAKLLDAVRGEPPRDRPAIIETLLRIAQLAERHPRITEMDINPLVAYERGVMAIDARVQVARESS